MIITAVLGGVGSLFSNAVAAIYLKMNTTASESLKEFHSLLVGSNRILLANLLATRIEDNEMRWNTLANLALEITSGKKGKSNTTGT